MSRARAPEAEAYSEAEIRRAIELLFFAYRDFTSGPDAVLAEHGYGRAHHRVIHFVGRHPGITVQQLLDILRITKQSLSRVLGALMRDGYIRQQKGERDRRLRHLFLTEQGEALEAACSAPQRQRVREAFEEAGPDAVASYQAVLKALVTPGDRQDVLTLLDDD
ncbi:MAG: MarR family winged helix-turn-helix transcriptional regulator [Minwuia sp.]|uniref:MarR family winged helix-turn-helix transcriptional regulator n=1 Tax=Minwuia sp. TaxID=2493630 RepID=UPI003A8419F7